MQVKESISTRLRPAKARLKSRPRRALAIIALVWVLCVVGASLFANRAKHVVSTGVQITLSKNSSPSVVVPLRHRILHFLSFGLLALLLMLAGDMNSRLLVIFAVAALGLGIEFAQHCIFGNNFEWWDVRDDSLGAIAAFLISRRAETSRIYLAEALFAINSMHNCYQTARRPRNSC
jgi:hypothetical protein